MTDTVAVVILNYNGVTFLERFLPPLIQFNDGYEIIVADNASTDNSVAMLRSVFPAIRVISLSKNFGFAGGYNEALTQVEASYYVLLNSDVEVSKGWLSPMISFIKERPSVGAVQPKILAQAEKAYFEYAGAAGGFLDKNGFPFCRGRIFSHVEKDHGQYDESIRVFWASGACLLIRSELYHQMGGLDEKFFAHMEEIDLCWRLNSAGHHIYCMPSSVVYHVGGGTLSVNSPRKVYLNFRNSLLMLYKNLSVSDFKKRYLARVFFDFLATINFLLTFQFKLIPTIIKAHIDFNRMKAGYENLPKNINKNLLKESTLVYRKSVVWDFFLKNKKRFLDLDF